MKGTPPGRRKTLPGKLYSIIFTLFEKNP